MRTAIAILLLCCAGCVSTRTWHDDADHRSNAQAAMVAEPGWLPAPNATQLLSRPDTTNKGPQNAHG